MIRSFILFLLVAIHTLCHAQQWIDKKYNYDSILNITYGSAINYAGGTDALKMDLFLPLCESGNDAKRPLLLIIHGGAFLEGSKNDPSIQYLCKQFARRGYVTASISYRLGFVSDEIAWNCNYPNYKCVFATDTAEWIRSYYRAVQDGKGALRFLVNRYQQFNIDTTHIFVAGESAGAFTAMGVSLLDTSIERPSQTFAIADAPRPSNNASDCSYATGKTFGTTIPRPDLGNIDGTIEPTHINYTIKGIGNMYGGMLGNLLQYSKQAKPKPAIYSFHQPCDPVVPIDSNLIYWGLSWCMNNGYNCFGISNTPKVYGSRTIRDWNTQNNYGYNIRNEFTTKNFPFSFGFPIAPPGSCLDQVNTPCHAYDNPTIRENQLAEFFATLNTQSSTCQPATTPINEWDPQPFTIYPNPVCNQMIVSVAYNQKGTINIYDASGKQLRNGLKLNGKSVIIETSGFASGLYFLEITWASQQKTIQKFVKE
jgi:hypothetical protein